MKDEYIILKNMPKYLRRIAREYLNNNLTDVAEVISGARFDVAKTTFENWGEWYEHDLVLLVPDHLMEKIPLNDQQRIESQLVRDLNKAAASVQDERVTSVHFEYSDEDEYVSDVLPDKRSISHSYDRLWRPKTIRAFISHSDAAKKYANQLAAELDIHGISSFVAHDAIEPDEDWQDEIELALQSMDVMLAFITDDFFESAWTNQEIGYALARKIPIISIKVGKQDPAGFIRNRQAIHGTIHNIEFVALQARNTLKKRLLRSARYRECTLHRFMDARSFKEAGNAFEDVKSLSNITDREVENLVQSFNSNNQLNQCYRLTEGDRFLDWVNQTSSVSYSAESGEIEKSEKP